jgi:general bacterial porin, GBP family
VKESLAAVVLSSTLTALAQAQSTVTIFVLESGARIGTGQSDVAGSIFNRQAYVGVKNNAFGALTVGRQYTPYYLALSTVADPFGAGYAVGNNTHVGSGDNAWNAGVRHTF